MRRLVVILFACTIGCSQPEKPKMKLSKPSVSVGGAMKFPKTDVDDKRVHVEQIEK